MYIIKEGVVFFMNKIKLQANAKINLFLDILGKRPDNFHEIRSVFQSISLADFVTVEKINNGIKIECSDPDVPLDQSNIVYKICKNFSNYTSVDVSVFIKIEKHIPLQAGLGGGSADGAAVLYALNLLYETTLSNEEIIRIGASVGSDIPFCYFGGTALVKGKGEIIEPIKPISIPELLIIKPHFSVSTAWAYSHYKDLKISAKPINDISNNIHSDLSNYCYNIFELICSDKHSEISEIKSMCKKMGAELVFMSGSGSSFFVIAESDVLFGIKSYYKSKDLFTWLGSSDSKAIRVLSS